VTQTEDMTPQPPDDQTPQIALVGNPNTGKTTLFGALTGTRQRVGNYPGVTVEKKTGMLSLVDGRMATLIDLPGTYSLAAASRDERVVIDVLAGHIESTQRPDLVVCVVDAENVMRNLFLASQVADMGLPLVVVLNRMDAAGEHGIEVDVRRLSERLGVPVVATVATTGQGMDELRRAIAGALADKPHLTPVAWPEAIAQAVGLVRQKVANTTGKWVSTAEIHRLLFDEDSAVADRIGWSAEQRRTETAEALGIIEEAGFMRYSAESVLRYSHLGEVLEGLITYPTQRRTSHSESIDRIFTHPVGGLVVFAGLMFVVFWSIYRLAGPLMDAVDWAFGALGDGVAPMLDGTPMLQSLVVDGVIGGVGGVGHLPAPDPHPLLLRQSPRRQWLHGAGGDSRRPAVPLVRAQRAQLRAHALQLRLRHPRRHGGPHHRRPQGAADHHPHRAADELFSPSAGLRHHDQRVHRAAVR
jgi:ferrous iron transport protein B